MTADAQLTRERIVAAAEELLRVYGPEKTTVLDVARAMGVSHAALYRHVPSKAALRAAVAEAWLARFCQPLDAIARDTSIPPLDRLRRWIEALHAGKKEQADNDPKLFETYKRIVASAPEPRSRHHETLIGQIAAIIEAGVASGAMRDVSEDGGPHGIARTVFDAVATFARPQHVDRWSDPECGQRLEAMIRFCQRALTAGAEPPG